MRTAALPLLLAAALAGCAETSRLPDRADVGPNPQLVQPVKSLIPTVKGPMRWAGRPAPHRSPRRACE